VFDETLISPRSKNWRERRLVEKLKQNDSEEVNIGTGW